MKYGNNKTRLIAIFAAVMLLTVAVVGAASIQWETTSGATFAIEDDSGNVVGPSIYFNDVTQLTSEEPVNGTSKTVDLGSTEFHSDGATYATVGGSDITGEVTTIRQIDTQSSTLVIRNGTTEAHVSGNVSFVEFRDVDLSDGQTTELSIDGPDGYVDFYAFQPDTYIRVNYGNGTSVIKYTGSNGALRIKPRSPVSASFEETSEPIVTNPSPVNDEPKSAPPVTLSTDVKHPDFEAGEEVSLKWRLNGDVKHTDIITSNGTYTHEMDGGIGGSNNWSATATDDSSGDTDSASGSYLLPKQLEIRDEQDPDTLINSSNATVEFYFDRTDTPDLIVTRDATNGTVDMAGLPIDEPFIVVAQADGYFNRRIFVTSLYETRSVYLLANDSDAVQPVFSLTDFTGDYPTEHTVIEIQRNINGSWETVEGDFFGAANEVGTQLEYNQRYRVVIRNIQTEETRDLGPITPTDSSLTELEVLDDGANININRPPILQLAPNIGSLPAKQNVTIDATTISRDFSFANYTVEVVAPDETTIASRSGTAANGSSYTFDVNLTEYERQQIDIVYTWQTESGLSDTVTESYDVRESFSTELALLPILTSLAPNGPSGFSSLFTIIVAMSAVGIASVRMNTGAAGLVGLGVLTIATMAGMFAVSWLFASVITWFVISGLKQRV